MLDITKLFGGNQQAADQAKEVGKVLIDPIGSIGDFLDEILD